MDHGSDLGSVAEYDRGGTEHRFLTLQIGVVGARDKWGELKGTDAVMFENSNLKKNYAAARS
jgi:hypothetical protein